MSAGCRTTVTGCDDTLRTRTEPLSTWPGVPRRCRAPAPPPGDSANAGALGDAGAAADARRAAEFLERPELTKALSEANLSQIASALTQTIYQLPWLEAEKLRSDPNGVETQLLNEALEAIRGVLKLSEDDS